MRTVEVLVWKVYKYIFEYMHSNICGEHVVGGQAKGL